MTRPGWIRLALIVGALALLEAACRFGFISKHAIIPPTVMVQGAWHALRSDETRGDLFLTLQTVALALVLSLVVVLILLFTGWKGWEMVYRHRVGVADG